MIVFDISVWLWIYKWIQLFGMDFFSFFLFNYDIVFWLKGEKGGILKFFMD